MDTQEIQSRFTTIFRQVFKQSDLQVTEAMTAQDVDGWDSLNHIVLISAVEREFKIKFKLRELLNVDKVGDLMALVATKSPPT